MKLTIDQEPCGILEFYNAVAKEMGYNDTSELYYDCTKINIAENIQDGFYDYYIKTIRETDTHFCESDARANITMFLAMSGPKVDYSLKANEVKVFSNFIC